MKRNSEREQHDEEDGYGELESSRSASSREYFHREEPARVHLTPEQRLQTVSSVETLTALSYMTSMCVGQASTQRPGFETSPRHHQEKCKQLTGPGAQAPRLSIAADGTRRRSSVNFKGRRRREYIPVWYQQAGLNSSSWFDGATYYDKIHNPSNQIGAFSPNVHVEEIVKKERRRRGIEDTEPYSDEDHKKKKKTKKGRRHSSIDSLGSRISIFQGSQPGGSLNPHSNQTHQSNARGHQHLYRTNVFYDNEALTAKCHREYHPHQSLPYLFDAGRTPHIYNVNATNQPPLLHTEHEVYQSATEELTLNDTNEKLSPSTKKSAHFSPSNDNSSGKARSTNKPSQHHGSKHHSHNNEMPSHRHSAKHHSSKHSGKSSDKHSHRDQSQHSKNSSGQHCPVKDGSSPQMSHSRHRPSSHRSCSRHRPSPHIRHSKQHLSEKKRSKNNSISRHQSPKQVGSGHTISTISVTTTVSSQIILASRRSSETSKSPQKTTDHQSRSHGGSSHRSSKRHGTRDHDSRHHSRDKSRPSDRSISRHRSPKQVRSGYRCHLSLSTSPSSGPLGPSQKSSSKLHSSNARSPHRACSRHCSYKIVSKSSHRSRSGLFSRNKTGSTHRSSKHRSVTSQHTNKSTSKHSGKSHSGEEHNKHCNCKKDICACKRVTCEARDKGTSQNTPSNHTKEFCHCRKENCACKSVTCGMRDKKPKREKCTCKKKSCYCHRVTCDVRDNRVNQETKPTIVPVHKNIKKNVTSETHVVEPDPLPDNEPNAVPSMEDIIVPTSRPKQASPSLSPTRYELPLTLPKKEETTPPPLERYESPPRLPEKVETPPAASQRYESPLRLPEKVEIPPSPPMRYEPPLRLPEKVEPPPPPPKRYESPLRLPEKVETPPAPPKRYESPLRLPEKVEPPPPPPTRYEPPLRLPEKVETAPPPPRRYVAPLRLTEREETPSPSSERYQSPLKHTPSPIKEESPTILHLQSPPSSSPTDSSNKPEKPVPKQVEVPRPESAPRKPENKYSSSNLMPIQPKCPQKSQTTRRPSRTSRSVSISRARLLGYIPTWYQRTGSTSSDWLDGALYYNKCNDPSNQVGSFSPHVDVEAAIKVEKRRRGIPNFSQYSNEDFHHKRKKKKNRNRRDSGSQDGDSRSIISGMSSYYSANMFESRRWDFSSPQPKIRHQVSVFNMYPDSYSPFQNKYNSFPSCLKARLSPTTSSIYAVASLPTAKTSGIKLVYNDPCFCNIDNCKCNYVPCDGKQKSRPMHEVKRNGNHEIDCPGEYLGMFAPRKCSISSDIQGDAFGHPQRGSGMRIWSPTRGNSHTSSMEPCMCEIDYCQCNYDPCISKPKKRRLKGKETKVHIYKRPKVRTIDDDKCSLCKVKAIETVFNIFMRGCCTTWVWSDREFTRHYGQPLGELPDYALKPPSIRESAIQKCWRERYESDSDDESEELVYVPA